MPDTRSDMVRAEMKILIVDDDQTILAILRDMIVELGHEVITARDAPEAMAVFDREKPDVIFLDYLMPRITGLEVLKHVRQQARGTFVVMLTRLSEVTLERMPGLHRADAFLEKPLRKPDIERVLATATRRLAARS